jgi:hypothetical protein
MASSSATSGRIIGATAQPRGGGPLLRQVLISAVILGTPVLSAMLVVSPGVICGLSQTRVISSEQRPD